MSRNKGNKKQASVTPTEIGAYEAKTHLSSILDRVAGGAEYTITKNGHPVARLIPISRTTVEERRATIEALLKFREQNKLGSKETLSDLINEGRKY